MKTRGTLQATHPLLWAGFPVLFLFAGNLGEVFLSDLWFSLICAEVLAILSYLIFVIITNEYYRATIHTSFFLLLFFSYGHVFTLLDSSAIVTSIFFYQIGRFTLGLFIFLVPAWIILLFLGEWWLFRKKLNYLTINKYLFIISVVLVGIQLFIIIPYEIARPAISGENKDNSKISVDSTAAITPLPDVYYIILDGYSRGDTLERMFGDNNEEFLNYLRKRNFVVTSSSRTNYVHTSTSLASSLNMEYVNYLNELPFDDNAVPFQKSRDSFLSRSLKSMGYSFVSFSSDNSPVRNNLFADKNIEYPLRFDFGGFNALLTDSTILQPFLAVTDIRRNRNALLYKFNQLADMPSYVDKPVFVFAHFIAPHSPYYFDKNCERESINRDDAWNSEKYYGMLRCVNEKVMVAVDEILEKSKISPIIVIQGDHGSDLSQQFKSRYEDLSEIDITERTNILNAYHVPNVDQEVWYDSITPVNSWRMIFKHYYGAEIDLLPDKTYWSEKETPYEFIEVVNGSS